MKLLGAGWKPYLNVLRSSEVILERRSDDTLSRPWLINTEKRILAAKSFADKQRCQQLHIPQMPSTDAICGSVDPLVDCPDHSIVRFVWQTVDSPGLVRNSVGYAAVYQDHVFLLFDEFTFVQYLEYSQLIISEETKSVLAAALECAVLGWTDRKCRMDSIDDMRRWHLDLSLYQTVVDQIAPPRVEVTETMRRLSIWVYHWEISGMFVQWAVTQPSSGETPFVERLNQVVPIDND